MIVVSRKTHILATLLLAFFVLPICAEAQEKCLQPGRIQTLRKQLISAEAQPEDLKLRDEFLAASRDLSNADAVVNKSLGKTADAVKVFKSLAAANTAKICSLLNQRDWPKASAIGKDGVAAFFYVMSKALPAAMQLELYPLVVDAFSTSQLDKNEVLASYIDRLRLAIGSKQMFGTQVIVRDEFLVVPPIQQFGRVDIRRAEFNLMPIRHYERLLELTYKMPLIRSVMEPELPGRVSENANAAITATLSTNEEEVLKVETAFVTLDVVIPDAPGMNAASLEKPDFKLFENDKPVTIETFAKAETPFDLVLLLDLSGSTADKVGLIRKTTRRFVEMKRPNDRAAVIAFHDTQKIVSELESNKEILLKRIKAIDGYGSSRIWEAVKFSLDMLDQRSEKGRRRAIVLMSDGVDNLLTFHPTLIPRMGFADLVDAVQRGTTAIFPIYLDTEPPDPFSKKVYADARRTLAYLADQSAGNMYTAKKLDDLTGIYDRVLKDVGTVYSIGFTPDVEPGDAKWRTLRVEVPTRPGLKLKHRPGYFVR